MAIVITPVTMRVVSLISGSVSFAIKVPGTYAGLFPADPIGSGRYFQSAEMISDDFVPGDIVKDLKLVDTDGVVSTPERALLPNYPDVLRFYDAADVANQNGVSFNALKPARFVPFDSSGQPTPRFLPAGLYLTGIFTTGGLAIGHVCTINIFWGRAVPGA